MSKRLRIIRTLRRMREASRCRPISANNANCAAGVRSARRPCIIEWHFTGVGGMGL